MTEKFTITELTPELKRLLEIIREGRDHTGKLLMLIESLDPMSAGQRDAAALAAGIFGSIGNVVNAITDSMPEATKEEAVKIVYGAHEGKPVELMENDLSLGGAVMTHLLVKALMKAAKEGKLDDAKKAVPGLLDMLAELGAADTEQPRGNAAAAQEYFDGISDETFADAEVKLSGYVGPVGPQGKRGQN